MKVIDLLNLIAKGEELPRIITWRNGIYKYNFRWKDYKKEAGEIYFFQTMLNRNSDMVSILNDEVEVMDNEEKEIEKIYFSVYERERLEQTALDKIETKINELIDVINDMRDKE